MPEQALDPQRHGNIRQEPAEASEGVSSYSTDSAMKSRALTLTLFLAALALAAQVSRDGSLKVIVRDATNGEPTPVRVRLTDASGNPPQQLGASEVSTSPFKPPPEAIAVMWGRSDRADGYVLQPDGSFYVDGSFSASLPAGRYQFELSKGYEYEAQVHEIELRPGQEINRSVDLERWIDMPARGWYSSDDHIHIRRSPRDNPAILRWIAAEDIHVGNLLQMGDFWTFVFSQYGWGETGRYREGNTILASGQEEPRTPEFGHTISLGADDFVRFQADYYAYGRVFDRVHELGGVSGFAHQGMSFHGYRGMTVNVLAGKLDFLELAQFCVPDGPIHTEHYYRFLDLGFRLTALAGSDFPWCGRGERGDPARFSQIGDARFYTYVGNDFSFDNWLAAVKAGRTFATTGPIIELTVNGNLPGDSVDVSKGAALQITAKAFGDGSRIGLTELEIVGHGEVLERATGQGERQLSAELQLPVERGIWIAARAAAGPGFVAHTTPVYVSVDGDGFHNPKTLEGNLERCRRDLADLERELRAPGEPLNSEAWRHADQLRHQIEETLETVRELGTQLRG